MVAHSGNQVKHTLGALNAIKENNRSEFIHHLQGLLDTLKKINKTMDTMWSHSSPEDYLKFRTFIMGTKNQVSLI
jgi:indoleamine 2,3-dioxygenase